MLINRRTISVFFCFLTALIVLFPVAGHAATEATNQPLTVASPGIPQEYWRGDDNGIVAVDADADGGLSNTSIAILAVLGAFIIAVLIFLVVRRGGRRYDVAPGMGSMREEYGEELAGGLIDEEKEEWEEDEEDDLDETHYT